METKTNPTNPIYDGLYDTEAISVVKAQKKTKKILDEYTAAKDLKLVRGSDFIINDGEDMTPKFEGLKTGLQSLDEELYGIKQGEIVLLGALTNVGKSTFAQYMALNFCEQDKKVVYFPIEDGTEMAQRNFKALGLANFKTYSDKVPISKNLWVVDDTSMEQFVFDKQKIIPVFDALKLENRGDIFVVDMLNSIADSLEDKDFSQFITLLRQHANHFGYTVILVCRFRQPQGANQKQRDHETYCPTIASFFGKATLAYVASKAIAMTAHPTEPNVRTFLVSKMKGGAIGQIPKRHFVIMNDKYEFRAPFTMKPELPAKILEDIL